MTLEELQKAFVAFQTNITQNVASLRDNLVQLRNEALKPTHDPRVDALIKVVEEQKRELDELKQYDSLVQKVLDDIRKNQKEYKVIETRKWWPFR